MAPSENEFDTPVLEWLETLFHCLAPNHLCYKNFKRIENVFFFTDIYCLMWLEKNPMRFSGEISHCHHLEGFFSPKLDILLGVSLVVSSFFSI